MLVLSRKEDQSIIFPNLGISIEIVRVQGNRVSVGVEAPKAIRIVRGELQSVAGPATKVSASDFQLGQFIEILSADARHEMHNRLNAASVAVHAAQKQFEQGCLENAEIFLSKAVEALDHLNKMFESPLPIASNNCVKESRPIYGQAARDLMNCKAEPRISIRDRGVTGWFSKPVNPHQLVEYLLQQLSSNN